MTLLLVSASIRNNFIGIEKIDSISVFYNTYKNTFILLKLSIFF